MNAYQWLIIYLIQETEDRRNQIISSGGDRFTARNDSQVYRASVLSKAFGEYTALQYYWSKLRSAESELVETLTNLGILYGLSCLEKHLVYFYQGEYAQGPHLSKQIKERILTLCLALKTDSLGIIDGIAPPDYVVNSVLGKSDGRVSNLLKILNKNKIEKKSYLHSCPLQVSIFSILFQLYENLQTTLMHNPGALSRPEWWHEIVTDSPNIPKIQSKL